MKPSLPTLCCLVLAVALSLQAQESFEGQDLKERKFSSQNLRGANFRECVLDHCDFTDASLVGADFRDSDLRWTSFFRADLTSVNFEGITFTGTLSDTNFTDANLKGVKFSNVTVSTCTFRNADLRGVSGLTDGSRCTFRGADLRGADLSKLLPPSVAAWSPSLDYAPNFRGAKYDAKTIFPKGIDPEAAGAVLVEGEEAKTE